MNRMQRWLLVAAAGFALAAVLQIAGCYKTLPPCGPDRVDYPRCDPTWPAAKQKRTDGGVPDAK